MQAQEITSDTAAAQIFNQADSFKVHIRNIIIYGNKKTKEYVILREMPFKKGDSILSQNLNAQLKIAKEFIYNSTLFIDVNVISQPVSAGETDVIVTVKERWYIFPIPYAELADRSFNEWVKDYDADFKRISYGIFFTHFNFSGRNDQFTLILINGFKRNVSFEYTTPFINKKLTKKLRFSGGLEQTRQIPFETSFDNKLVYYKTDFFVKKEWYATAAFLLRKKLKETETFTLRYRHLKVADSIISFYNPRYFDEIKSTQDILELEYKYRFTDVDNVGYPLTGKAYSVIFKKTGLGFSGGINSFSIEPRFEKFMPLGNKWYSSVLVEGLIRFPFDPAYFNLKGLGYEDDYLRGYEYFVIDGFAYALAKLDLKKEIIRFNVPTFIKSKTYNKIPFTLYAKTFADLGAGFSRFDSELNNKMLYSGGVGIDIVTFYDIKVSLEFSLNHLGQKGLFLHR